MVSLRGPKKKILVNCQVLTEVAVSLFIQSRCNGKLHGLPRVLARVVCETGPSHLATLKLSRAVYNPQPIFEYCFVFQLSGVILFLVESSLWGPTLHLETSKIAVRHGPGSLQKT